MNLKTELVALAVRYLTDQKVISQPQGFDEFFAVLATGKTHDVRTAESMIATADKLAGFAKRTHAVRKFEKSIPDHV